MSTGDEVYAMIGHLAVDDEVKQTLLSVLTDDPNLIQLIWAFAPVALPVLLQAMKFNSHLVELDLSMTHLTEQEAVDIGDMLQHNGHLKRLYLQHNNLGSQGIQSISYGLGRNCSLEQLNLKHTRMGDLGLCNLILGMNNTLQCLDISSNDITDIGGSALAQTLFGLKELILYDNKIGDLTAEAFARSLKKNTTLKVLGLSHNSIGTSGAIALAQSLNTTLTTLYLYETNIGKEGACALKSALEENHTMTELNINGNNLDTPILDEIYKLCQDNLIDSPEKY